MLDKVVRAGTSTSAECRRGKVNLHHSLLPMRTACMVKNDSGNRLQHLQCHTECRTEHKSVDAQHEPSGKKKSTIVSTNLICSNPLCYSTSFRCQHL
jgi:hypothetical protein